MPTPLRVTGDPAADKFLRDDPLALLIGMLLDQQVPMEWAFIGPYRLAERLDGPWEASTMAAMDPEVLADLFKAKPALHRYPTNMAKRTHALCQHLVDNYDGDAANVWKGVRSGATIYDRLLALPGFGDEKARIFLSLLAKRFGKTPSGWQEAAGAFGDDQLRSVADIDGPEALMAVRAYKQELKAKGRNKQGHKAKP